MSDITVPGARKPSTACKSFIKDYEKCRLQAFLPTPDDVPTIGWGATGPDIHLGLEWTQWLADDRFERDIKMFAAGVDHEIGAAPTTQGQFDALVSFAYNEGLHHFAGSTLLKLHKGGMFAAAAGQFPKWNLQKNKVLRGLSARRAAEAEMYRDRERAY